MLADLTTWILDAIRAHGILGVIMGVALESIIVPIPSPVVIMAAGAVLVEQGASLSAALPTLLFVITVPATIAAWLFSFFPYGVAYFGGKPLLEKTERFLGIGWSDIEKVRARLSKGMSDEVSIAFLRALPVMPLSLVSAAAGAIKMDWRRYSLATLAGLVPRILILSLLGWKLGELYMGLALRFESIESVISVTLILCLAGFIIVKRIGLSDRIRERLLR